MFKLNNTWLCTYLSSTDRQAYHFVKISTTRRMKTKLITCTLLFPCHLFGSCVLPREGKLTFLIYKSIQLDLHGIGAYFLILVKLPFLIYKTDKQPVLWVKFFYGGFKVFVSNIQTDRYMFDFK